MGLLNEQLFICWLWLALVSCKTHTYEPLNHYAAFNHGGKNVLPTEINLKDFPEAYSDIDYFKFKVDNLKYKLSASKLDSFSLRTEDETIAWFYRRAFNSKNVFVKRIPNDSLIVFEYATSHKIGFSLAYLTGYTLANLAMGTAPSTNELVYQPLAASELLDLDSPIYLIERDSTLYKIESD